MTYGVPWKVAPNGLRWSLKAYIVLPVSLYLFWSLGSLRQSQGFWHLLWLLWGAPTGYERPFRGCRLAVSLG